MSKDTETLTIALTKGRILKETRRCLRLQALSRLRTSKRAAN